MGPGQCSVCPLRPHPSWGVCSSHSLRVPSWEAMPVAWLGPELEVEMILRTMEGTGHSLIKHGSHSPLPLLPFYKPPREKGAGWGALCFIPLKRLRGASGAPVLYKCQCWAGRTTSPSGHDPLAKSLCSDSPRQAQLVPRVAEVRFWTLHPPSSQIQFPRRTHLFSEAKD